MSEVAQAQPIERPRITAILNVFGAAGANRCQVLVRADGAVEIHGDEASLAKAPLAALRSIDLRRFGNHRAP